MRIAVVIAISMLLSGCVAVSTCEFSIETKDTNLVDWDLSNPEQRDLQRRIRDLAADEVRTISDKERHYVFYSGEVLRAGSGITAAKTEREQLVVVVRDGQVARRFRNQQLIDLSMAGCMFIPAGHGVSDCWNNKDQLRADWGKVQKTVSSRCGL